MTFPPGREPDADPVGPASAPVPASSDALRSGPPAPASASTPGEPGSVTDEEVIAQSTTGAAKTTAAGLIGRAAGLLTTLLVTHCLSREEYGRANLAMIVAMLVNVATFLSPQQALLTRRQEFTAAARLVHGWAVWSGLLIALLLAAVARPLMGLLREPAAAPLLYVFCAALLIERIGTVPQVALRYRLRFRDVVRVDLGGDLCYVAVTAGTAIAGLGPLCLALGAAARQLGRLFLLLFSRPRPEVGWPVLPRLRSPDERRLAGQIARFSWPIHIAGFSEYLTLYLDNVFVGLIYSEAAQGLYAVGYTLIMTPTDTIALYGTTAMVRALGVKGRAVRQRVFLQGVRYVSLLLFPISIGAVLIARTLEVSLLPERWHGVAAIITGLSLASATQGLYRLAFAHLSALQRPRLVGMINAGRLGLFGLGLYAVAHLDAGRSFVAGTAWAVSAAFVLSALLGLLLSARVDGISVRRVAGALAPPVLGTVVMAAGLLGLLRGLDRAGVAPTGARLLCEVAAGAALYVGYLRIGHAALWREAVSWLRGRRG